MSRQKYYFKGRDLIKIRSLVFNILTALIICLVSVLSFFVSPGFSLGWKDQEWLKPGCPETASGNWIVDNPANTKLKSLSIDKNQVIYTSQNGEDQKFRIIKSASVLKNPYVEMKLKSFNKEEERVVKIRPHLVHIDSKDQEETSNCLIKVFSYKNEKHAKADKYSGWNIYRLKK